MSSGSEAENRTERGNVAVEGRLDLSHTSYYNAEEHGTMSTDTDETGDSGASGGETIAGTTEDDLGELSTDDWPSAVDEDALNTPTQREVIRVAALHRKWTYEQIGAAVGVTGRSVSQTLRDHWPERKGGTSSPTTSAETVREIHERLLDGETAADISEAVDCSHSSVTNIAKGETLADVLEQEGLVPLAWSSSHGWHVPEGEGGESIEEGGESESEEEEPARDDDLRGEVRTALNAIEATATHDETRRAAAYVREIVDGGGGL